MIHDIDILISLFGKPDTIHSAGNTDVCSVLATCGTMPVALSASRKSSKKIRMIYIEEEEFSGWEYDEEIISIPEYISTLSDKNSVDITALIITGLMQEIDELKTKVEALEGSI